MPADTNPDAVTLEWKKGFPTLDGDYYSRIDEYDKQPTAIRIKSRASQTAAAVYEFGCEKDLRREYESEDYEYLGPIDAPALCATVRALRSRTAYDWANIIEKLQDENDALREQLAAAEHELRRRRNGDELPSGWTVMDAGDGFPNLYLYSRADIVVQAKARLESLQSQLAQVTQERDEQVHQAELAQERLQTAVQLALQGLHERCCEVAALQWFQSEYAAAVEKVRDVDEATVFTLRKGLPTLTGERLP